MPQTLVASKSIEAAALYNPVPIEWHAYIWPFTFLYPTWAYFYFFEYDTYIGGAEWTFVSLGSLLTIHMLTFLFTQWSVSLKAKMTCKKATDPKTAKLIMIIPSKDKGKGAICKILHGKDEISFFFQKKKYIYSEEKHQFIKIRYLTASHPPLSTFQESEGFISEKHVKAAEEMYGLNRFDIPVPTFQELFKEHAVAPFFVFQLFCVALWCLDEYWYYSIFTLVMLVIFESTVVWQRLKTLNEFRAMGQQPYPIYVRRAKKWVQIQSDELLPGDICSIIRSKDESSVPCDMVIVDGGLIVNEAMLSGESTPLLKESVALRDGNDELDFTGVDKNNCLYGGTKVLQVTSPTKNVGLTPPDNGCLCFVVRTGFGTSQGKLVRTMIYSTERVSANNLEALLFILFLTLFAIAAAWYVWTEGVKNDRKRSKLLLDCILIITSVVPPELPMELSLAVNTSLVALARYAIFCTEPFRIPVAGKVDICCFDKTGTLTAENLVVEGVAGIKRNEEQTELIPPTETPRETIWVLAAAHSLVQLEDGVVGDPMERATVESLEWQLGKNDTVHPKEQGKGQRQSIQIKRRFQFSSALKRQSSVVHLIASEFSVAKTLVAVKGAPETLKAMYLSLPTNYEETYKFFTRRGSRVIALGYKFLKDNMNKDAINSLSRENIESDLNFAGFLVFTNPLKADAKEALQMLNESSHRCIMITGDNPLTACHVAREVAIIEREVLILDKKEDAKHDDDLHFYSIDEKIRIDVDPSQPIDPKILLDYDICLTGAAMSRLMGQHTFKDVLNHTWVYARVSPSQKEFILMGLKNLGYITLMAGDGTNDVGALKQAHVGVALLDGTPEDLKKIADRQRIDRLKTMYESQVKLAERFGAPPPPPPPQIAHLFPQNQPRTQPGGQVAPTTAAANMTSNLFGNLEDLEEEPPTIKFGDASVAAPFTSKLTNVTAIPTVIRQGRCTLVATIQMYKILALNCLISAYSLSVLYLDGIKSGDMQLTISGMLIAVCFMCISRAQPLEKLSKERPQTNILNAYIILSVLLQFSVHIAAFIYIKQLSNAYEPPRAVELEGEFEPNLLNTAVYLVNLIMQVSTFAINYQGYPFRERIQDNKMLYYGLLSVGSIAFAGATEFIPEANEKLQLVPMESSFKQKLVWCMLLDLGLAWLIEVGTKALFADNKAKPIARRNR